MGCCQSRRPISIQPKKVTQNKQNLVDSVTSVTRSETTIQDNEQLNDYVNNLKKVYSYEKFKAVWFNSCQEIQLYQDYSLQTERYSISCTVIDINSQKSAGFKFAIIAPELTEINAENVKNLVFVYCKEKRLDNKDKVIPVVINIEKSKVNKQENSFQFIADLNMIIKLNIKIQLYELS